MLVSVLLILQTLTMPAQAMPSVERGKYMFTVGLCSFCHTNDPAKPLAGGYALNSDFGVFYTPNITPDIKTGIGGWTAAQFLKAMRQGIDPDGSYYYPSFPFTNYTKMSDDDILSIFQYLMSQPAISQVNPPSQLKAPYNNRKLLFFWRGLYFPKSADAGTDDYLIAQGPWKNIDSKSASWNRGAYLIEGPLHCTACHTPRDLLGGLIKNKWMSGAILNREAVPNISPDQKTGLAAWSTSDWKTFFKTGADPMGTPVAGDMHKIVRLVTSQMTDEDVLAITEYLQSLPAVESTTGN